MAERKPDRAAAEARVAAFAAYFKARARGEVSRFEKAILFDFIYWEQTEEVAKENGPPPGGPSTGG